MSRVSLGETRSHLEGPFGGVLGAVLLQLGQLMESLSAPQTLVLLLSVVDTLVFVEMFPLLEALVARRALVGLLACMHPSMSLQI